MEPFDLIEQAAEPFILIGFEPYDSEPGEWLVLRSEDDRVVYIDDNGDAREFAHVNDYEAAAVGGEL